MNVTPKTLGIVAICGVALLLVQIFSVPGVIPQEAYDKLLMGGAQQCVGKKQCILVYVTPWCPACKSSGPFLSELSDELKGKDTGLIIAVGQDTKEKVETMAASLGGNVLRDPSGEISRAFRVRGVPHWVVWDSDRKVLAKLGSGTPSGGSGSKERIDYFLKSILGLKEL